MSGLRRQDGAALALVRASARLLPASQRAGWLREWTAELHSTSSASGWPLLRAHRRSGRCGRIVVASATWVGFGNRRRATRCALGCASAHIQCVRYHRAGAWHRRLVGCVCGRARRGAGAVAVPGCRSAGRCLGPESIARHRAQWPDPGQRGRFARPESSLRGPCRLVRGRATNDERLVRRLVERLPGGFVRAHQGGRGAGHRGLLCGDGRATDARPGFHRSRSGRRRSGCCAESPPSGAGSWAATRLPLARQSPSTTRASRSWA